MAPALVPMGQTRCCMELHIPRRDCSPASAEECRPLAVEEEASSVERTDEAPDTLGLAGSRGQMGSQELVGSRNRTDGLPEVAGGFENHFDPVN